MRRGCPFADVNASRPAPKGKGFRGSFFFARVLPGACGIDQNGSMAGYSGTPLLRKLGIRDGTQIVALHPPEGYASLLGPLPPGAQIVAEPRQRVAFVHLFTRSAAELRSALTRLRAKLVSDGMIWVSWPKRSSKVPTDITEDVIREVALPLGFVDIKVCAVDDTWSGLKLVVRVENR